MPVLCAATGRPPQKIGVVIAHAFIGCACRGEALLTCPHVRLLSSAYQRSTELFAFLSATSMFSYRVSAFIRPARVLKRHLATQSDGAFSIPIIDFSKFRSAASREEKEKTAGEIVSAFKSAGFVYLTNHGITSGEKESPLIPWGLKALMFMYHSHRRDQKCIRQGGYLNTLLRARLTI